MFTYDLCGGDSCSILFNPALWPGGTFTDDDPNQVSNLANHFEFRLGDIDQGFKEAEVSA